jgi:hypothetical protein
MGEFLRVSTFPRQRVINAVAGESIYLIQVNTSLEAMSGSVDVSLTVMLFVIVAP